jgi:hypothetical protein
MQDEREWRMTKHGADCRRFRETIPKPSRLLDGQAPMNALREELPAWFRRQFDAAA